MKDTSDGFIDLESLYQNWRKFVQNKTITYNDLCGPYYNGYWLNFKKEQKDQQHWFLKCPKTVSNQQNGIPMRFYSEILLEELASKVNILAIHSRIAVLNQQKNSYGLLSLDYNKVGYDVISGASIVNEYLTYLEQNKLLLETLDARTISHITKNINSLDFIWEAFLYHFRSYQNKDMIIEKCMNELVKRYIFQFILMQEDFHLANWEVYENGTDARLTPIYDMDMGLRDSFFKLEKNNSLRSSMNPIHDIYEDFKNFYESSSAYFKNECTYQLSTLTPDSLLTSMKNMETTYPIVIPVEIKTSFLERYQKHYEKLNQIVNSKGMTK